MQDLHAVHQLHALILFGLVRHHYYFHGAFGLHRLRDLGHRMPFLALADLLATGHRNRVVVQNLVGDVDAGSNALAYGEQAAMEVGAVAQIGEHMLVGAEGLLPYPRHALTAHLGKAHRAAVHPQRHVVAAYAGHGA